MWLRGKVALITLGAEGLGVGMFEQSNLMLVSAD